MTNWEAGPAPCNSIHVQGNSLKAAPLLTGSNRQGLTDPNPSWSEQRKDVHEEQLRTTVYSQSWRPAEGYVKEQDGVLSPPLVVHPFPCPSICCCVPEVSQLLLLPAWTLRLVPLIESDSSAPHPARRQGTDTQAARQAFSADAQPEYKQTSLNTLNLEVLGFEVWSVLSTLKTAPL